MRPASTGKVIVQVKKKGSSTWTNLTTVSESTDGLWSKRIKVSSTASYRYAWTPAPTALVPFPAPKFSGAVSIATAKKLKSPLKAASPA